MSVWRFLQGVAPNYVLENVERYTHKLVDVVYPCVQITFQEFKEGRAMYSEAYSAIQNYLSEHSSSRAKRLKGDIVKESESLVLTIDDQVEVSEEFQGVKIWWASKKNIPKSQSVSIYPAEEKRFYQLTFHRRHRVLITGPYLNHVLAEGKAIGLRNRKRKLYSNSPVQSWSGHKKTKWDPVTFEHPATFGTLAMDPTKKDDIMDDLKRFTEGKDYYAKIGKAWKRGYLLYGPPGTGKSSMIAAMANFLNYDVYDIELTAVKNNSELRRLMNDTPNKSIMVIEDIDCSIDLTGQRSKKSKDPEAEDQDMDPISVIAKEEEDKGKMGMVTLSGLLNVIDGLWSACGGERIIVFTTNHIDSLDPALIRRGRIDKRIEMSYCCFESFRLLARNYLDMEFHDLFEEIKILLEEVEITPADVAENLLAKSNDDGDKEFCLKNLIDALKMVKEEARIKAKEELCGLNEEKEDKIMRKKSRVEIKDEKRKKGKCVKTDLPK